jgi:hypothetical protein
LDKVPTGSEGASGTVGDEEETVRGEDDRGVKSRAGGVNRRNRGGIRRTDRNSSSSRNGGNGNGKRKRVRGSRDGNVLKLKHRRVISGQGRREPHVVVHLDAKRGFKRVDERGVGVIQITEIRGVDRCRRKEGWRKRREGLGGVFEEWRGRVSVATNEVGSETSRFYNLIRSTFAIGKFSNSASRGVAVHLDGSHDKITDSKGNRGARSIGAFTMDGTALFGEETEDLFSELSSGASETEEGMDIGGLLLGRSRGWR